MAYLVDRHTSGGALRSQVHNCQPHENTPLDLSRLEAPIVLVTTEGWNRLTDRAINFVMQLSPGVVAVHLTALAGPGVDEKRHVLRVQ